MDVGAGGRIQGDSIFIEMLWAGNDLDSGELGDVSVPDVAVEAERGATAFALDVDEAGVRQLLEVVRDGSWAENFLLIERTARASVLAGDLLQDGEAAGVGNSAGDDLHLVVRKMFSRLRHG